MTRSCALAALVSALHGALSSLRILAKTGLLKNGAGGTRTHDLRFRKPSLYPAELQPQGRAIGRGFGIIGHRPGGSDDGDGKQAR
jgi:hypothetical protein